MRSPTHGVFGSVALLVALTGGAIAFAEDGPTTSSASDIAAAHEAAAPRATRNLASLIHSAEAHWPGLRAAHLRIDAAEAQLNEAWATPYSQAVVTGGLAAVPGSRGTPVFSPDSQLPINNQWGVAAGIRVDYTIPLFTFGQLSSVRDLARANIRNTNADERRVREQLRFDVRRAYFALGLALDAQQMISEGRGKLDESVQKLEERIAAGDPDANEMDRWRLASTLAEVEGRSSEAQRLGSISYDAVSTLAGETDFDIPDCPLLPVELELASLAHYQTLARSERPEAAQLNAAVAAREAALGIARSDLFPKIGVILSAGLTRAPGITDQSNPFVQDPANTPTLAASLGMRWNLDLYGTAMRMRRANAELSETHERINEAQSGLDIEVANAYEELLDARRRETAWGRGHRETRAWFLAATQAFQIGTVEPRDVVDALRGYFQARFSHIQATHDVNIATAKLERAIGVELLPIDGWEAACGE